MLFMSVKNNTAVKFIFFIFDVSNQLSLSSTVLYCNSIFFSNSSFIWTSGFQLGVREGTFGGVRRDLGEVQTFLPNCSLIYVTLKDNAYVANVRIFVSIMLYGRLTVMCCDVMEDTVKSTWDTFSGDHTVKISFLVFVKFWCKILIIESFVYFLFL